MEINSLVTHKHLNSLGIGVVAENLKNAIRVKFGENDVRKFKPAELKSLDLSKCPTVMTSEFERENFRNSVKNEYMIRGNHVEQFTDLGWIYIRIVQEEDLKKYRRVV